MYVFECYGSYTNHEFTATVLSYLNSDTAGEIFLFLMHFPHRLARLDAARISYTQLRCLRLPPPKHQYPRQRKRSIQKRSTCFASQTLLIRVPKGGPWSPGALILFWLWSLEPSIFKFDHLFPDCIDSWLLPFCVCLCVLTGIKKHNLKRVQYIIQVYAVILVIMICNNLFRDLMKTLL